MQSIAEFMQTYAKELFSLLVSLVKWFFGTRTSSRARLIFSNRHAYTHLVEVPWCAPDGSVISPNQRVVTRSLLIKNVGKQIATKVEIVFNWKPLSINVWPIRSFTEPVQPNGRYGMIFESLAPSEILNLEVLTVNADMPDVVTVRCDQGEPEVVTMTYVPLTKPWKDKLNRILQFVGLAALVYFSILLIRFMVLRTP